MLMISCSILSCTSLYRCVPDYRILDSLGGIDESDRLVTDMYLPNVYQSISKSLFIDSLH